MHLKINLHTFTGCKSTGYLFFSLTILIKLYELPQYPANVLGGFLAIRG